MTDYIDKNVKLLCLCMLLLSALALTPHMISHYMNNEMIGGDTSIFAVMGKGWLHGLMPYRDLFDHKGPLLFLFYAFAACIPDIQSGLDMLSILFLFIDLLIAYRIAGLYLPPLYRWAVLITVILPYITLMQVGAEELSLPFNLLPLYYIFRYFRSQKSERFSFPSRDAFIIGLCIGAHAMIRANNAAPAAAAMVALGLLMMFNREWKSLFRVVALSVAGMILFIAPFVLYFYLNDALDDFIYANITFQIEYSGGVQITNSIKNFIKSTYLFILCFVCLVNIRKKIFTTGEILTLMLISLGSVFVSCMSFAFSHYLISAIPAYVLIASVVLNMHKYGILNKIIALSAFALLVLPFAKLSHLMPCGEMNMGETSKEQNNIIYTPDYLRNTILPLIPDSERNSCLVYGSFCSEYLALDIIPCIKFFCLQNTHTNPSHPHNYRLMYRLMHANPPKWILLPNPSLYLPTEMRTIMNNEYKEMHNDGRYVLYQLL